MKESVLGVFCAAGAGGAKPCDVVATAAVEGSWRCAMLGEVIGASMMFMSMVCLLSFFLVDK